MSGVSQISTSGSMASYGVLVTPIERKEIEESKPMLVTTELQALKVDAAHFDKLDWVDSLIATKLLGEPIKVARWPSPSRIRNNLAKGLFLFIDPEEREFAKVRFKIVDGAVFIATADGSRLDEKYVEVLLDYLGSIAETMTSYAREKHGVSAVTKVNEGTEEVAESAANASDEGVSLAKSEEMTAESKELAKKAAMAKLTKDAFLEHLECYRAKKMGDGAKGWTDVAAP